MANFLKEMAKKEVLAPHLNAWFSKAEFPDTISFEINLNKPKDDAFHPSSDAACCAQYLYAKRAGDLEQVPFAGSSYKAFMAGHYWHALIQHILVEELGFSTWEDIEKERWKTRSGPSICRGIVWRARGFIDVAHCRVPGHGDVLVDIKTMGGHSFKADRLKQDLWDKYYAQLQLYLDWENQETAIMLCVEKDSPHRFKEFTIKRDRDFAEAIYTRWDVVTQALKQGVPPACDLRTKHETCPVDNLYEGIYHD